jgi:hypothetical protein
MALKTELMAFGMPHGQAGALGFDAVQTVVGAGTNQATATVLLGTFTLVSTAPASTGVLLRSAGARGPQIIYNGGANTLKVYGNGSDTINGIAGSTGVSVPTLKTALFVAAGAGTISIISA